MRDGGDELLPYLFERALRGQVAERVHDPVLEVDAGDRQPQLAPVDLDRHGLRRRRAAGRGKRNALRARLEARKSIRGTASDHCIAARAGDRLGCSVPEPDHALRVEQHNAVADCGEHACSLRLLLDLAVEPRILDRDSRSAGQELGEQQVALLEPPAGFRGDESDRTDEAVAQRNRDAHVRRQRQLIQEVQMFDVAGRGDEQLARDRRHHRRLAGANDMVDAAWRIRIFRIAVLQYVIVD